MRERQQEQVARPAATSTAVTENVVRMAEQARETRFKSGALDYLERNRRQIEQLQRAFRPHQFAQLERLRGQSESLLRSDGFGEDSAPARTDREIGRRRRPRRDGTSAAHRRLALLGGLHEAGRVAAA
jgi:hypothetical protein